MEYYFHLISHECLQDLIIHGYPGGLSEPLLKLGRGGVTMYVSVLTIGGICQNGVPVYQNLVYDAKAMMMVILLFAYIT